MGSLPHNLPLQATSFVGREQEIREINELLAYRRCRLLTLVGPGGIGKTRLALQVARGFVDPAMDTTASIVYPDGVYLVNLQPVAAPDDIVTTIASAVGFHFYDARDPDGQLIRFLANKQALLLLDNFEHLLPGVELVQRLLSESPGVDLLVTSRAPLNMTQEWLYQVDGMAYPRDGSPDTLDTYSAVQLFLERARQTRHDFSLEDEGPCVAEICRLAEGMPLGIELAAAWLRRLSGRDIVRQLRRSLDILESEAHDLPDRHRSMRAVFDHSWKLLSPDERLVLMKLSVFRGGFSQQAAEYVAGASLQILASLVDQSLIRLTSKGRYEIHELQRQFAAERLAEMPEMEKDTRDRHCAYFANFMRQPARNLIGKQSDESIQALEADIDNLRTAWNWALENTKIDELRKSMETMYWFSWLRGWPGEVEQALRQAVARLREAESSPERDVTLALALSFLGRLDDLAVRTRQAQEEIRESLSILRRYDAGPELAQAMMFGAIVAVNLRENPEEARMLALEAAALLEETGQYEYQAEMYHYLGWLAECLGQYAESERWYRKALKLGGIIGYQKIISYDLMSLGKCAFFTGDYATARHYLQESLTTARENDIGPGMILPFIVSGEVAAATGRLEEAEMYLHEALAIAREWGQEYRIAESLVPLAHLMVAQGKVKRAAELYQEALDIIPQSGSLEFRIRALTGLGWTAYQSGEYDQARKYHGDSLDMSLQLGDRCHISENLNGLGRVVLAEGDKDLARQHFLAALLESLAIGAPPIILHSLGNDAGLFRQDGDLALAARLATLILNHSGAHFRTKRQAEQLLERLEAEMPAMAFRIACKRGASDELDPAAEEVADRLAAMDDQAAPASQSQVDPLSERELEVLRLVALGKSNREIAAELTLALGTVKSHLHHIYQKLGVSSRTQAVARARELQLA